MKKLFLHYYALILTCCFIFFGQLSAQKALITVPIADLVGQPLASYFKNKKSVEEAYASLAWAAVGPHHHEACPRLHQALFNEVVDLVEVRGKEARIRITNMFYTTYQSQTPKTDYWTLRSNLITFDELKKKEVDIKKIPTPIDYSANNIKTCLSNCITLTQPFYEPTLKQTLSAGTRLIKTAIQSKKDKVSVYLFNPHAFHFIITEVPIASAYKHVQTNYAQARKDFIALIRTWTQAQGIIPYVWGGCSVTTLHTDNSFSKHPTILDNNPTTLIHRPEGMRNPKGGLDCSGLIARAAQAVGLPYYFKNSYTLANKLTPLEPKEKLHEGDILWIAGHVIIVASRTHGTILEARHYDHGYGKIHEIALKEQFKDIHSFEDLENAYAKHIPLIRLDKNGNKAETYKSFKLLKLASIWQ